MASNGDQPNSSQHIVMFPWLAFGHMLPFLELSKSLARRGHRISFISTPRNIQRLPNLPPEIAHLIHLIPFTLPQTSGLREAAEATTDLPPNEVPYLKKAIDGLQQPFYHFIKHLHPKPNWIVQDFVQHWIPAIGAEFNIPCMYFVTISAASQVFLGPVWNPSSRPITQTAFLEPPPWIDFPSKLAYRPHELVKLIEHSKLPNPSEVPDVHRFKSAMQGSTAIVVRSCNELEPEYVSLLGDIFKKPVHPVGLLPPLMTERDECANQTEITIRKWLDEQKPRSVLYIALGTEAGITVELLQGLASGLEAAKLPFIWGLRKPSGMLEDANVLPEGFEDRTKGFGLVVMGWVPQVKILGHESVGGFLTHCGWSSIIEGLQAGHPFVLFPLDLDQGLNARLMDEKGMGVEVERNHDGSFTKESLAKAVRLVMVDDEGEKYRKKAQEMKEIVADRQCHEKYIDDFVEYLVGNRNIEG